MKYVFFAACVFVLSCKKPSAPAATLPEPTPLTDQGIFEKLGHRGSKAFMPENTIGGMYKAIDMHVTNLEMDLAVTKDNKVIVTHDPFFNHNISTKPDGQYVTEAEEASLNMYQMTYSQVRLFDVGLKPRITYSTLERVPAIVPTLADLIDSVELYCVQKGVAPVRYNVEIKSNPFVEGTYYPAVKEYVDLVMAVVNAKNVGSRVVVTSFDTRALQHMHQKYPAIKTCLNSTNLGNIVNDVNSLGFYPAYYSADYTTITAPLIDKAHQLGVKVIAFTVNTKNEISNLKAIGVNGIITDIPPLFD